MKNYTIKQMREAEQRAVSRGIGFDALMEAAGTSAAQDLSARIAAGSRILFVCGKGNNGGDALVMARVMKLKGYVADVVFVAGTALSDLAETNRVRLQQADKEAVIDWPQALCRLKNQAYAALVDGIFGIGFCGALPEEIAGVCDTLNNSDGLKVALDIPSGLNADTAEADAHTFCADLTYAFGALKPAHANESGRQLCGETVYLDIGID